MARRSQRSRGQLAKPTAAVPTSTGEMRKFLLEQMVAAAEGKLQRDTAGTICRFAQQAYNFSKLELRAAELAARHRDIQITSWDFETTVEDGTDD